MPESPSPTMSAAIGGGSCTASPPPIAALMVGLDGTVHYDCYPATTPHDGIAPLVHGDLFRLCSDARAMGDLSWQSAAHRQHGRAARSRGGEGAVGAEIEGPLHRRAGSDRQSADRIGTWCL